MNLDEQQREQVTRLSTGLLDALERISKVARARLVVSADPSDPSKYLAFNPNSLVHGPAPATKWLNAGIYQAREHLLLLTREPFVARVKVVWDGQDDESTIYLCRASAINVDHAISDAQVVSYGRPLGRLAEFKAGQRVTIHTPGGARNGFLKERVRLRPAAIDGSWDALDDRLEFDDWEVSLDSLRRFVEEAAQLVEAGGEIPDVLGALLQQGAEAVLVRDHLKRTVIDRMSLRDQPILDSYQGEVFRLPLDRRLLLLGPPGTGKTTTLIRRLAQKRTPEGLSEEEVEALSRAGVRDTLASSTWAMFSPTELLKLYLREAFNREAVPASDQNLRTWDRQRLDLARNVLGILRSAESGRFQLDDSAMFLADTSSHGGMRLYERFSAAFDESVLTRFAKAFEEIRSSEDVELRERVSQIVGRFGPDEPLSLAHLARILERSNELQPILKRLGQELADEVRRLGNRVLRQHPQLLNEIVERVQNLTSDDGGDEDEEDEADDTPLTQTSRVQTPEARQQVAAELFITALRRQARASAMGRRVSGRAGRVLAIVGDRLPPADEMLSLGERVVSREQLRGLVQSPRQFVMSASTVYANFRSRALREDRLFRPEAAEAMRQGSISPDEVDVVILVMLRNARRLLEAVRWSPPSQGVDWLEAIRREHLTQVFVDEATDFSPVQLACTMELTHPRLRSWFACGDLDQRITDNGLQDRSEIDWLSGMVGQEIDVREVRIAYRQSRRLRELAAGLSGKTGAEVPIGSPDWNEDADVWPLLAENVSGELVARWLAERIADVETAVGQLPSIAVFVDGETQIDPIVDSLRSHLASRNVRVVGCRDGRDVGNELEVRVFDVRHIKGLEFEAVFFVGIDRLAERLPALFDRYFYVGASRAATYLGVTCEGHLPAGLEQVRQHFDTNGWQS